MSTFIPLLSRAQIEDLPVRAREVVEYRKSGLSLNHIQGCPLDCAYCIRHTYGLWDHRAPRALMSDAAAVEDLVTHRYFQADVTPLQIFNRATDPFLPNVRPHTLAVLDDLDARGLRNHVLVITRHQMKPEDIGSLNELVNIKLTLLFTYSGIDDKRIEPYPSRVAAESLKLMSAQKTSTGCWNRATASRRGADHADRRPGPGRFRPDPRRHAVRGRDHRQPGDHQRILLQLERHRRHDLPAAREPAHLHDPQGRARRGHRRSGGTGRGRPARSRRDHGRAFQQRLRDAHHRTHPRPDDTA